MVALRKKNGFRIVILRIISRDSWFTLARGSRSFFVCSIYCLERLQGAWMKTGLTALVVVIALLGAVIAAPKTGLEYEGLVGPVHKVETRSPSLTELGGTQSDRPLKLDDIKIFDRAGNLVELQEFRWNGALRVRQVIAYDSRGYQSELIEYRPDGTVKATHKGGFDANRNMYATPGLR